MTKLGLFCIPPEGNSGPHKVTRNLLRGIEKIGVEVSVNTPCALNGCLSSSAPSYKELPRRTLMGPNLVVTPDDDPGLWGRYDNFVVPSKWVADLYAGFPVTSGKKVSVWPVGIDTDLFCGGFHKSCDCLIYVKNRSETLVSCIKDMLNDRGISSQVLRYGSYSEENMLDCTRDCRFCILLDHTESQGIAYMEILSAGLPMFVVDQPEWRPGVPATSVPYFSEECGLISDQDVDNSFDVFRASLHKYSPREYITREHCLAASASKYCKLIEESHDNG